MKHPHWSVRRRAWLALLCAVVSAGFLAASTVSQAAPTAKTPRAEVALAPAYWSNYGQTIVNYYSGKCLQPRSYAAQAFIEQRTCNGSSLQRWKLSDPGTGYAVLVNQGSGQCMDLYANSEAEIGNGTLLEQFYCNVVYTTQQWYRTWGSRRYHYQVETRIKNLCLDVRDRSTADGALLQVWSCSYYETAQQFRFQDA